MSPTTKPTTAPPYIFSLVSLGPLATCMALAVLVLMRVAEADQRRTGESEGARGTLRCRTLAANDLSFAPLAGPRDRNGLRR